MGTIRINDATIRQSLQYILGNNVNGRLSNSAAQFWLCDGTMATQAQLDDYTQNASSLWSSQRLMTLSIGLISNPGSGPYVRAYNFKTSSFDRAGTATWFVWMANNTTNSNKGFMGRIAGTVGTIGSGADLEFTDVNITSTTQVKIANLKITIPAEYTY